MGRGIVGGRGIVEELPAGAILIVRIPCRALTVCVPKSRRYGFDTAFLIWRGMKEWM